MNVDYHPHPHFTTQANTCLTPSFDFFSSRRFISRAVWINKTTFLHSHHPILSSSIPKNPNPSFYPCYSIVLCVSVFDEGLHDFSTHPLSDHQRQWCWRADEMCSSQPQKSGKMSQNAFPSRPRRLSATQNPIMMFVYRWFLPRKKKTLICQFIRILGEVSREKKSQRRGERDASESM